MDYLRQTRHHLQNALENSDSVLDLHEGTDIDEEMAALTAIAGSVRQEASGIADLAKTSRGRLGDAVRGGRSAA